MKVVGFNGSPRKDGNTFSLLTCLFEELQQKGIETELIQLSDHPIRGCISCYKCFQNKDHRCAMDNDAANEFIAKIAKADGVVLASPVFFADVTPEIKALIDRAGFVSKANAGMYRNKLGAAVAALRRFGGVTTVDTLTHFLLSQEMIIVGRTIAIGHDRGEVEKDHEGIQMTKALGSRMAWLLKKLHPERRKFIVSHR
jgi:multimeric flavodoxin WrbA